jgi:hypothetical protein
VASLLIKARRAIYFHTVSPQLSRSSSEVKADPFFTSYPHRTAIQFAMYFMPRRENPGEFMLRGGVY